MSIEIQARILVTGASGDSAQGVIRALRATNHNHFIASVCINERNHGFFLSDASAIAPQFEFADLYIDFLVDFIHHHKINVLIPTIDGELPLISKRSLEIEKRSGARVIVGSHEAVLTCCDKMESSLYLKNLGVSQPSIIQGGFEGVRRCIKDGYSVIMKPRFGGGSRGIRIIGMDSMYTDEWIKDDFIFQRFESYDKEFTATILKEGADVVAMAVLERTLSGGRTVWCRRVPSGSYEDMLKVVASGLELPYLNIQFGMVGLEYQVFDLNPRFSGSTEVFSMIFNGPDLLVSKAMNGSMPVFSCSPNYFEASRHHKDFIVDWLPNE